MQRWLTPITSLLVALLVLAGDAYGQTSPPATGRGPSVTVTRLVKLFSGLETDWLAAVRTRDEVALGALLAEDFEMRLASRAAEPIPRAEWIQHALASPTTARWTVREMAARDLGCAVVVSFRLEPGAGAPGARPVFVVDTWVQEQGTWRVAARYVSAAGGPPLGLPGETMLPGTVPKKY